MGLAESSSSDRQPERSGGMRSGLAPLFCFLAWPVISSDGADRVRSVNFWHLVYIDQRFRLHRRFGILGEPSPCPHRTSCTANEYPWMAAKKSQPLIYKGCAVVVTVGLEPTVSLRFARSVKFAIGVQTPWSGACTCCSLRFRLRFIRHWRRSAPRPMM